MYYHLAINNLRKGFMVSNIDGTVIPILKKLTYSQLRQVTAHLGEKREQNKKDTLLKLDKIERIRLMEAVRSAIISMVAKES